MVAGRICRVVADEGSFIQRQWKTVVYQEGSLMRGSTALCFYFFVFYVCIYSDLLLTYILCKHVV